MNEWKQNEDRQKMASNEGFKNEFASQYGSGLAIAWTGYLEKINKDKKNQERLFVLTNKHLINFGNPDGWGHYFQSIWYRTNVRRCVYFVDIKYITYFKNSQDFILHINDSDYDFHQRAQERDKIIYKILFHTKSSRKDNMIKFNIVETLDSQSKLQCRYDRKKSQSLPEEFFTGKELKSFDSEDGFKEFLEGKGLSENNEDDRKPHNNLEKIPGFDIIKLIGQRNEDSTTKIFLAEQKDTKQLYAIKIFRYKPVYDEILDLSDKENQEIKNEKNILSKIGDNPFLQGIEYCYRQSKRVYFVMKFIQGGNLETQWSMTKSRKPLPESTVKFYAAQIVLALSSLHKQKIVHRDQKLEDILVDVNGYIKQIDFGKSKQLLDSEKTNTNVGNCIYISPEILLKKGHNYATDWWSFGVIIYELLTGKLPFSDPNQQNMVKKIVNKKNIEWPEDLDISDACKNFVENLLKKEPEERLGGHSGPEGADEVKGDPWWNQNSQNYIDDIYNFKIKAPIVPTIKDKHDLSNFKSKIVDTPIDKSIANDNSKRKIF